MQTNQPFKVYKALSGVGKPYKLWDPVDLESDEDILKLERDPRVCTSSIFSGAWRHTRVLELLKGNGGERTVAEMRRG